MMPTRWREIFLVHAETAAYRERVAATRDALTALGSTPVVVPFSGGKDSTTLLHLARCSLNDLLALHYDFGRPEHKRYNAFPAAMERAILDAGQTIAGQPVHVITKRKYWPNDDAARADRPPGTYVFWLPDDASWIAGSVEVARRVGCTINLVALRREESRRRKRRIDAGRGVGVLPECWPLADWRELDVWAYLVTHDLPYPAIYDQRAAALGGYLGLRLTSLFRDPTEASVGAEAIDGVLHWRERGG